MRKKVLELVVLSETNGIPASALVLTASGGNHSIHLQKCFKSLLMLAKPNDPSATSSSSSAFVPVLVTLHSLMLNYINYSLELALRCPGLFAWYFSFAGTACRAVCPRFGSEFSVLLPIEPS